jgi:FeS assembly SUF system protein
MPWKTWKRKDSEKSPTPFRTQAEEAEENAEAVPVQVHDAELEFTEDDVVAALRTVYDPEIPLNVYDLGLIYKITSQKDATVLIDMTLTSPNCPEAEIIPFKIETAVLGVPGVEKAKVAIVWEPPWSPDVMSEAARLELGML